MSRCGDGHRAVAKRTKEADHEASANDVVTVAGSLEVLTPHAVAVGNKVVMVKKNCMFCMYYFKEHFV